MNYVAAAAGGAIGMMLASLTDLPVDWRTLLLVWFGYAWGRLIVPLFDKA